MSTAPSATAVPQASPVEAAESAAWSAAEEQAEETVQAETAPAPGQEVAPDQEAMAGGTS
ncbi:MAG: hypothetical protein JSR62_10030 [Nitrospira sp.]|nr:hypothetical protein [Nitrospira sp.]